MAELHCQLIEVWRNTCSHESVGPTNWIKDVISGGSWLENTEITLHGPTWELLNELPTGLGVFTLLSNKNTLIKEKRIKKKIKALVQREKALSYRTGPPPSSKKYVTRDVTTKTCPSIICNMLRFALMHTYTRTYNYAHLSDQEMARIKWCWWHHPLEQRPPLATQWRGARGDDSRHF